MFVIISIIGSAAYANGMHYTDALSSLIDVRCTLHISESYEYDNGARTGRHGKFTDEKNASILT